MQRLLLAGQVLDKSIQNPQAGRRNVLAYKENSRIDSENLGHFDDLAQRRIDLSSLQGINVGMITAFSLLSGNVHSLHVNLLSEN